MPSVFKKRGTYWARLKIDGDWKSRPTHETDRGRALEFARSAQDAIDEKEKRAAADGTLNAWVSKWMEMRKQEVHDWKKELGRLNNHVLPVLGHMQLVDITPKHIADLIHDLRFTKGKANRTARSVYTVMVALFRKAAVNGLIKQSPCLLNVNELGSVVDKDPEWRAGALFTRAEAETMISDRRIPLDRRVVYAFGLLAGLRPGEAAALRWRNYDQTREPLGCLTVALAYSTPNDKVKSTKTNAVRNVPVHPVLAVLLAEWRAGWIVMFGREPTPEDLIVPLPPEASARRTTRKGEPYRSSNYTLRRWTDTDEKRLGWIESVGRHRSVYDTKSTFITLAIDDGADRNILRDRITHTKPRRDAFDGYDRGPHWVETCEAVLKLHIRYLAPRLLPAGGSPASDWNHDGSAGEMAPEEGIEGSDSRAFERVCSPIVDGEQVDLRTTCDRAMALLRVTACDHTKGGGSR